MAHVAIKLMANVEHDPERGIRLAFQNPAYYRNLLRKFESDKKVSVTIENLRSHRSLQQNRYLWGVVYPIIAEATGYTVNELHEWARAQYLKPRVIEVAGMTRNVTRSTTELSKGEMVEYVDELIRLGAELGYHVPSPEEAGYISNYSPSGKHS
jgi:hypothetical protein